MSPSSKFLLRLNDTMVLDEHKVYLDVEMFCNNSHILLVVIDGYVFTPKEHLRPQ